MNNCSGPSRGVCSKSGNCKCNNPLIRGPDCSEDAYNASATHLGPLFDVKGTSTKTYYVYFKPLKPNETFIMTFEMNITNANNYTKCSGSANHTFNTTMDIFISWTKQDYFFTPNEFNYDFVIWGTPCNSTLTIDDTMVPKADGFVAAIRVNAFDTRMGESNNYTLKATSFIPISSTSKA
jgi:hypothetical protein